MITFRQKEYSEFDAGRELYVELMKRAGNDRRQKPNIINTTALLPILKGNNIVIERFVISTSMLGKDKYRMYLKIGAKVKLPDGVRLRSQEQEKSLGGLKLTVSGNLFDSDTAKDAKKAGFSSRIEGGPSFDMRYKESELLGEVIKYDKVARSLILEFKSVNDAINALEVLPFGLDYKLYLLDA